MTTARGLEGGYRRLLRWYPSSYRKRHEEEILGVLMAAAHPGQGRPGARESADLLWSALKIRIRMTLRGADSQPWQAALALVGVLLPLLMLLKLTEFLYRGARYGFGTPADLIIGAYGEPGSYARSFQRGPVRPGGRHLPVQPDQPTTAGIGRQHARRCPAAADLAGRDSALAGAPAPRWTGRPRPPSHARGCLTPARAVTPLPGVPARPGST